MKESEVLDLLKQVKNPFTEVDIVSEGLVSAVLINGDDVRIYLGFARNKPPGPVSSALSWPIQAKIIRDIVGVLGDKIRKLEIIDDTTLRRYYPAEEV